MIRRYVWDELLDAVVEVGEVRPSADPAARHADVQGEYRDRSGREASEKLGADLRAAALDRADRREWAHKRFGTERRWAD